MIEFGGVDLTWFIVFMVLAMLFLGMIFFAKTFEFYGGVAVNKLAIGSVVTIFLSVSIGILFMVLLIVPGFTIEISGYEPVDLFIVLFVFGFLSAMVASIYSLHVQRGGY
jgi:uncharacterized membrane protein